MSNFGRKREISAKRRVCQKVIKASAKYLNKMTKRGILTNGDLPENYKFGKNL